MLELTKPESCTLQSVPFGAPVAEIAEIFARDGAVVLENVLSPATVAQVNRDLEEELGSLRCG